MPLSPKILTKPTTKDFTNIVLFLFRQIDPNYKCTGKFEDEMIAMFKYLGYPFQISKSNISAVGSPHAWPTLLASIMWLVELLNYDEATANSNLYAVEPELDDPSASEKAFYKYLHKAYGMFLSGRDEQYALLEEQFVASFENKNVLIRDQIEALEKRNQTLVHEIEEVKSRSAYLPKLENKKREFLADLRQFQALMEELVRHRDQLKEKTTSRQAEYDRLAESIKAEMDCIEDLNTRIGQQELSPEDVNNMVSERERLHEAHKAAGEKRLTMQRKTWELEVKLRDKVEELENAVRAYHEAAEELKLVPFNARNAHGQDLSIVIDIRAKRKDGLVKTDIQGSICPVLEHFRQNVAEATKTARSELLSVQDLMAELESSKTQLMEAQNTAEAKLRRAEGMYRREKDSLDQNVDLHGKELDSMEARLVQLRDTAAEEAHLTAAARRANEINALRKAKRVEHERKRTAMVEAIMEVVAQCAGHREQVQRELEDTKKLYEGRLQDFLEVDESRMLESPESFHQLSQQLLDSSLSTSELPHFRLSRSGVKKQRESIPRDEEVPFSDPREQRFGQLSAVEESDAVQFEDEDNMSPIPLPPVRGAGAKNGPPLAEMYNYDQEKGELDDSVMPGDNNQDMTGNDDDTDNWDLLAAATNLSNLAPTTHVDPRRTLTDKFEDCAQADQRLLKNRMV